ncbi:MAG: 30S ribosomal protein S2 [bacterium]
MTNPNPVEVTVKTSIPEMQLFLKAGSQFGHQVNKWNPKMREYIFTKRGNIHIIDLTKTLPMLETALDFLAKAAATGDLLFVGTKRQASEIVKEAAMEAGAYYITTRWPGGLLTNFELIKKSLKQFNALESEFETGVQDRTKFEVSQMKKDWAKMNRLYEGIKKMDRFPKVVVIVDSHYERNAVKEARKLKIPVVAMVDTNSDPTVVDYVIPANDDALSSIKLIISLIAAAVKKGNQGRGVRHFYKDYAKEDIKIVKSQGTEAEVAEIVSTEAPKRVLAVTPVVQLTQKLKTGKAKSQDKKGMLESIQKEAETIKIKKAEKTRTKE